MEINLIWISAPPMEPFPVIEECRDGTTEQTTGQTCHMDVSIYIKYHMFRLRLLSKYLALLPTKFNQCRECRKSAIVGTEQSR